MPTEAPGRVKALWTANLVILAITVTASFVMDMNCRLPGLDRGPSIAIAAVLFGAGLTVDVAVFVADRGRRAGALLVWATYALMLLPLAWWW